MNDGTGVPARTHCDVVVVGGRIAEIRFADPSSGGEGFEVLDGRGRHLIPGMWETQAHLTRYANGIPEQHDVDWPADGDFEILDANTRSYLRHGFTTVVDLGGPEEILGRQRIRIETGELAGPRLLYVGRQFVPTGGLPRFGDRPMTSLLVECDEPAEVVEALDRMAALGIAAAKINHIPEMLPFGAGWPKMERGTIEKLVEHAHHLGLPVLVHIDRADSAAEVLRIGVDGIEHFPEVHDRDIDADVELLTELCLKHDAYWSMTLSFHEAFARLGDPILFDDLDVEGQVLPRVLRELVEDPRSMWSDTPDDIVSYFGGRFDGAMSQVKAVHDAGVKMTLSSDSGNAGTFHGLTVRRELELMEVAGIAPADILQCATRLAAEKFNRGHDLGTIEAGKLADLVLLGADPLEQIANVRQIEAVVRGGVVHRPGDIPL